MASGGFVEEMMREQSLLEATCGDLFDHIDDLLDFPKDDSAADVLLLDAPAPGSPLSARIIDVGNAAAGQSSAPAVEPTMVPLDADAAFFASAAAPVFDAKDVGGHIGSCEDLDMDMAQLEWLSGLFDDASIPHEPAFPGSACAAPIKSSALAAANAGVALLPPDKMEDALFRSSSPISVLEHGSFNPNNNAGSASSSSSSASSSSESFSGSGGGHAWSAPVSPRPEPPVLVIPARARSKRSRPSAFTRAAVDAPTILVPTPMYSSASSHSDPESIAESSPHPAPPPMKKKKKAKKPAPPAPAASDADGDNDGDADYEEGGERALPPGAVRRCTHCQIEKTPQWRAGPLGPKTLCNACGVRYKSGRLFPEYRPAASPTFVPSIHSNSHKKVVEMRQKAVRSGDPSCDLLQFIRRRD